jgi:DNA-nicking Smr family endonuclease
MWSFSKASTPTLITLLSAAQSRRRACALVAHGAYRSDLGRVGVLKGLVAELHSSSLARAKPALTGSRIIAC